MVVCCLFYCLFGWYIHRQWPGFGGQGSKVNGMREVMIGWSIWMPRILENGGRDAASGDML